MTALRVAFAELQRFSRGVLPKLVMISVLCIPLLYGGVYLYSNWDPYGNLGRVTGALVVSDAGGKDNSGQEMNTGHDVAQELKDQKKFDWQETGTREEAVQKVADGDVDFALVIPKDFTENLLSTSRFSQTKDGKPGAVDPQKAGLEVITNDANNYVLTNIVATAGTAVRDKVAGQVGEKTADSMLASFTTIHDKMAQAGDGSKKITDGTVSLSDALGQLRDGSGTLADGTQQLADGAGSLKDGQDQLVDADRQAVDGATRLNAGATKLDSGAGTLAGGTQQLADGSAALKDGTQQLADSTGTLKDGTQQLADGSGALKDGTQQLADGSARLRDGNQSVADGAAQLARGTSELDTQLKQSGASQAASGLRGVCKDLSAVNDEQATGRLGTDVSHAVADQVGKSTAARLAPLVKDGTLTQAQADQVVADLSGEKAQQDLAAATATGLDSFEGTDIGSSLAQLRGSTCATDGTSTVADKIDQLDDGVARLDEGAAKLSEGAGAARDASAKLADGAGTLNDKTGQLADGAARVNDGAGKLSAGAGTLNTKTGELADGAAQVNQGAQTLSQGTGSLVSGTGSLKDGAGQLLDGQVKARDGAGSLLDGARQANDGASRLADGSGQAKDGADRLHDGSSKLTDGIKQGAGQVPALSGNQRGSLASVMSDPVQKDSNKLASAPTYGQGMAPFFLALALWIGVLMAGQFLRAGNSRALTSNASTLRIALGTWLPFAVVGVGQALVLYTVVRFGLGLEMAHPWLLLWLILLISVTFSALAQGFITLLGSPGKLVVLILLILQLVTSGGLMPYETLPDPLRWLHHVLPMGYAISGIRRLAYGIDVGSVPGIAWLLIGYLLIGLLLGLLGTMKARTWTLKTLHPEVEV